MHSDYRKKSKIACSMFPSPGISNLVVEPYNMVLGMMQLLENANFSILFDNEALYKICSNHLEKESPNYTDINEMLARALSTCFSSTRFKSSINLSLNEMITNLVPYRPIHFATLSYAPFGKSMKNQGMSVEDITNVAFNQDSVMLSSNFKLDKYIACCVTYRGRVDIETVVNAVNELKSLRKLKMVDWCPTGFKTGITYRDPVSIKKTGEVGVLMNSTSLAEVFEKQQQKFYSLYRQRAFVHWFVGVGMESGEFAEAAANFDNIKKNYEQMSYEYSQISLMGGGGGG